MKFYLIILLLLTGFPALAMPSSLIVIPNTDVEPYREWHLDLDNLLFTSGGSTGAFASDGVLYGALPRLELGVDAINNFANIKRTLSNPFWFNGKFQLIPSIVSPFALAVGAEFVTAQPSANAQLLYLVGSYRFSSFRITAGGYNGLQSTLGDHYGAMLGAEYFADPWWYGVDYQSGYNVFGTVNAGIGYHLTDTWLLIVDYDFLQRAAPPGGKRFAQCRGGDRSEMSGCCDPNGTPAPACEPHYEPGRGL